MESKPIKRNKHILPLSKDHHFTLLFCWKIRQGIKNGIDAVRIKNYVQYFWQQDMQEHFREEERILFALVTNENVTKAIYDHKQIKEQVERILEKMSKINLTKQFLALADTVDAHVRFEERELFPLLEQLLTDEQLEAIGEQLNAAPPSQDNYHDEFWRKQL